MAQARDFHNPFERERGSAAIYWEERPNSEVFPQCFRAARLEFSSTRGRDRRELSRDARSWNFDGSSEKKLFHNDNEQRHEIVRLTISSAYTINYSVRLTRFKILQSERRSLNQLT